MEEHLDQVKRPRAQTLMDPSKHPQIVAGRWADQASLACGCLEGPRCAITIEKPRGETRPERPSVTTTTVFMQSMHGVLAVKQHCGLWSARGTFANLCRGTFRGTLRGRSAISALSHEHTMNPPGLYPPPTSSAPNAFGNQPAYGGPGICLEDTPSIESDGLIWRDL
ncbi:hypothetical protein FQA47_013856 [Oryzias melastigma]|uniref:Uncharacterized protein n=1 Tax=Oryzias melastigma TaxID=30732 RepID=A0A834F167_ORYME|nr:hypothetical protein FQA47_013856 [Oryzias melastigma]